MPGTRYPKSAEKMVWLIYIQVPSELMDDVKEGSIELADQTIDLEELDDSYDEDLDKDDNVEDEEGDVGQMGPADQGMMPAPQM